MIPDVRTLGAYNDEAKRGTRPLDFASGFTPFIATLPDSANSYVPSLSTYQPTINLPPGSLLWAISGNSSDAAGFTLQLTDAGKNQQLFGQAIAIKNLTGGALTLKDTYGANHSFANPLHLLPEPAVIVAPGTLIATLKNLAGAPAELQACLHFAIPAGPRAGNAADQLLDHRFQLAGRAVRTAAAAAAIATADEGTALITGGSTTDPTSTPANDNPFDVSALGDNIVVPASTGFRIAIYELDLWSPIQQHVKLLAGTPGGVPVRGPLYDFQGGFYLGDKKDPHYVLPFNTPFVINLSAGTAGTNGPATGNIKVRYLKTWGS